MPQFDLSTAPSQIFWLVVIFTALFLVLWRLVLPRMSQVMETRQKKIDDDLARAERLKAEAEAVLADYERALSEARSKAGEAMKQASDAAAAEAARRVEAFSAELAEKTKAAEARIAAAEKTARENLTTIAVEAAQLATAKLLGVQPSAAETEAAVAGAMKSPAVSGGGREEARD